MRASDLRGSAILLTVSAIWGLGFVAQSAGMETLGPFAFTFLRYVIAAAALFIVVLVRHKRNSDIKTLLKGGIICGATLGAATCLQQYGLMYTTAGKAGFITALYIIMIPIAGRIIGKKCGKRIISAVALAVVGVYMLCVNESFTINKGDIYEFLCAVIFTVQIMAVSHFSTRADVYNLSCLQFAAASAVAAPPMLATETVSPDSIRLSWLPLLYAGVFSGGIAYTLQIIGQRNLKNPTVAAIIMSMESCVSVIGGWLILGQALSARGIIGCVIMLAAIIIAQLPNKSG